MLRAMVWHRCALCEHVTLAQDCRIAGVVDAMVRSATALWSFLCEATNPGEGMHDGAPQSPKSAMRMLQRAIDAHDTYAVRCIMMRL